MRRGYPYSCSSSYSMHCHNGPYSIGLDLSIYALCNAYPADEDTWENIFVSERNRDMDYVRLSMACCNANINRKLRKCVKFCAAIFGSKRVEVGLPVCGRTFLFRINTK